MKVLYHLPDQKSLYADRFIAEGYRDAFADMGHDFRLFTTGQDLETTIADFMPDIFITSLYYYQIFDISILRRARSHGLRVFFNAPLSRQWNYNNEIVQIVRNRGFGDVHFGSFPEDSTLDLVELFGQPYFHLPLAANKKFHFPVSADPALGCDIFFMGAKLADKKNAFKMYLYPLMGRKYNLKILGQDWTTTSIWLRKFDALFKKIGLGNVALGRQLIVPFDKENVLYSSAKISINLHTDRQQIENTDVNERTFKIPACGGFEICDPLPIVRRYFTENEVVVAENSSDWFRKIDYYLHHDKEREAIRVRGTNKALQQHTYNNRVQQIIEIYKAF